MTASELLEWREAAELPKGLLDQLRDIAARRAERAEASAQRLVPNAKSCGRTPCRVGRGEGTARNAECPEPWSLYHTNQCSEPAHALSSVQVSRNAPQACIVALPLFNWQ